MNSFKVTLIGIVFSFLFLYQNLLASNSPDCNLNFLPETCVTLKIVFDELNEKDRNSHLNPDSSNGRKRKSKRLNLNKDVTSVASNDLLLNLLNENSSIDKRKKIKINAVVPYSTPMTTDQINEIIDTETLSIKTSNMDQLRKTLNLILKNDLVAFLNDYPNFKRAFNCSYSLYSKRTIRFYLLRYVFMFAADNLLRIFESQSSYLMLLDETHDIVRSIKYILATKSMEFAFKMIAGNSKIFYPAHIKTEIIEACKEKYPLANYFQNIFIELFAFDHQAFHFLEIVPMISSISEFNDQEIFNRIAQLAKTAPITGSSSILSKIVLDRTFLFLNLTKNLKSDFILFLIRSDDSENLLKVLEIDPELVIDLNNEICSVQSLNILHVTVLGNGNFICFKTIIKLFPELMSISVIKTAYSRPDKEFLPFLDSVGFKWDTLIEINDQKGKTIKLNLLQFAFKNSFKPAYEYYAKQIGLEATKEFIHEFWDTPEKILDALSVQINYEFIKLIVNQFKIDVNFPNYRRGNLLGNAKIFFNCHSFGSCAKKIHSAIGLNFFVPAYIINEITGMKRILYF